MDNQIFSACSVETNIGYFFMLISRFREYAQSNQMDKQIYVLSYKISQLAIVDWAL